jgi:hypothetical protein
MKTPAEIAIPPSPLVRPNTDIPKGVRVERQPEGGINSANDAGGYVPPDRFNSHSK